MGLSSGEIGTILFILIIVNLWIESLWQSTTHSSLLSS